MLVRFGAYFRKLIAALALIATLGVSVLPNGQIPKIAGPCGRALCNCPPVLSDVFQFRDAIGSSHCKSCVRRSPLRVLTLGPSLFSGVEASGLALQPVLDVALAPKKFDLTIFTNAHSAAQIVSVGFALGSVSFEIATPPPRFC